MLSCDGWVAARCARGGGAGRPPVRLYWRSPANSSIPAAGRGAVRVLSDLQPGSPLCPLGLHYQHTGQTPAAAAASLRKLFNAWPGDGWNMLCTDAKDCIALIVDSDKYYCSVLAHHIEQQSVTIQNFHIPVAGGGGRSDNRIDCQHLYSPLHYKFI